ncbi:hypothetical protein E2562_028959 [Oryza meyeriana var. granulata]|uniref:FAD-dependent oxidoreductase 2 FAD binding domain-containing protein n=1 Tax=Oryza meyeriana var. granulata TaxID=110450 RepID=A0A6G1DPN8_9ORYZ|nr:hypothetical protein E2562_028959 [Oryza meyeriana var. granulata]
MAVRWESYHDRASTAAACPSQKEDEQQSLVVVGGGAAGVYASIRAKTLAPHLNVLVFEKGRFLSKVKISGGGRCNVTNGHHHEPLGMARNYPRGHRELRGSFFKTHGPQDTMRWFSDHGVELKAGKAVSGASVTENGEFVVKVEKRTIDFVDYINANYVLVATGSSQQGYSISAQFGHSIIAPVPSLFTFKITEKRLADLSGVTFPRVKAKLKLDGIQKNAPELTQTGPMLVTHWGLSGPVVLRLSAWGARELHQYNYQAKLTVDFIPDIHIEDVKRILFQHKDHHAGIDGDMHWASIPNNNINTIALRLKQWIFEVVAKGQFKDEFVTAGECMEWWVYSWDKHRNIGVKQQSQAATAAFATRRIMKDHTAKRTPACSYYRRLTLTNDIVEMYIEVNDR